MSAEYAETAILDRENLTVTDLYADLVNRMVRDRQLELASLSDSVVFLDGADALCAAVAHLRDGAMRMSAGDVALHARLTSLAAEVLIEAVRFEERADS
jgi:hypothetical protein